MAMLWSFHTWNLQGQISPTDFYHGLEQITCGDGLLSVLVSIYYTYLYITNDCDNADGFQGSLGSVDVDGA